MWTPRKEPTHEIVPFDAAVMAGRITGKKPVRDFIGDYIIPQADEFIDMYDPELLWFDGDWTTSISDLRSPEIVSHFYNKAQDRKEVAVNDRMGDGTRFNLGDFYTSEYGSNLSLGSRFLHKWEECRGISQSFGYNWQDTAENVITLPSLIDNLVKIVSEGGNLLLIVNLDGTGAMPEYFHDRLQEIGAWLKTNGAAIYATRPWLVPGQGDKIRFTRSKDVRLIYVIYTGWPEGSIAVDDLVLDPASRVRLLAANQTVPWRQVLHENGYNRKYDRGGRVVIDVPDALRSAVDARTPLVLEIQLAE